MRYRFTYWSNISLLLFFVAFFHAAGAAQSLSAEEVIGKHLDSIGPKDALAKITNQLLFGTVQFRLQGSGMVEGKALILSAAGKTLWGMNFNSNDYPIDRFAFDGKQVRVAFSTPGRRSLLGQYVNDHRDLLKGSVLGGVLSNSWTLLKLGDNAKVKLGGTKTIDGIELITVEYSPKGGSDVATKLYFDPATFRHVRSEHTVLQAAIQGPGIDNSAGQSGMIFRLVEEFSDFKKMNGLTLPSTYKVTYSADGAQSISTVAGANRTAEWKFTFTDFAMNRDLDANSFSIGSQ